MKFEIRYYTLAILLSICVLVETLALTYMQENGSVFYYSSSLLYFLSGILICIIPIISGADTGKYLKENEFIGKSIPYLTVLFFIALTVYHIVALKQIYRTVPIDKKWADMLPSIILACQRFLQGKIVYGPAPEIFNNSIIPYLPLMWMPFLPAVMFDFDPRWITLAAEFTGIFIILIKVIRRNVVIPFIPILIGGVGLFLLLNYLIIKNPTYWSMTEEGLVAGFYMILSLVLLRSNYWVIGLAMTACTLSRYSLLFWIPVYFAYVLFTKPRSDFWKLFISYTVSMLLLFILPYFIKDPQYFIGIPMGYSRLTHKFWAINRIDAHLYYNVGLFKFFNQDNCYLMSFWEIVTSLAAPVLFIFISQKSKPRFELNKKYISFCSFKLSLIFFFSFIQMPYMYIFVPVTLISYVVLFEYLIVQMDTL